MVLVDRKIMPKTHEELKDWVIEKSREKDYLVLTDVAEDVADIISLSLIHISEPTRPS